jgi:hypothetical protein
VAFIDDDLTILRNEVFDSCLVLSALDDSNVYETAALILPAANLTN